MLAPIKIIITGTSLLLNNNPIPQNRVFYLDNNYSSEASEYMKKIHPEKSDPLRDILYKTIYEENRTK
jgi:hypothetical protein